MSVINQMLKDLEKRSKASSKPNVTLAGMYKIPVQQKKLGHPSFVILAFFMITCFLISLPYLIKNRNSHPQKLDSISYIQPTTIVSVNKNSVDSEVNVDTTSAIMTGITLQTQSDMTFLRFLLNNEVLYRIDADIIKNQFIIVLEHTRLLTNLPPINYANSAIQHISMMNNENGDLKILIHLNQGALLQHLEFNETSKFPELQVDIRQQNPFVNLQTSKEIQTINPTSVKKLVVDMNIEEDYQRALGFASQGQLNKAIQMLTEFVAKSPLYSPARQTLITLLLQENRQQQAEKVVDMGLVQQPNYLPFIELKARILVNENKISQALVLLERITPSINDHPDFYAFIAALYQRQGQAKFAAKLYEQLLMLQPTKGVWWIGLAIALESQGKHSEAQEAYARADSGQGLSPELKAYVETELHES